MEKTFIHIAAQTEFSMYFEKVTEKYSQNPNLIINAREAVSALVVTYQGVPMLPEKVFPILDTMLDNDLENVFLLLYERLNKNQPITFHNIPNQLTIEILEFSRFIGPLLQNTNRLKAQRNKSLALAVSTLKSSLLNKALKTSNLAIEWLVKWAGYLQIEDSRTPFKIAYYHQGEILLVDFGFRIGSEFGGRHYAIVMEKHNNPKSPVIILTPISSVKPNAKIPHGNVGLGQLVNNVYSMAVVNQTGTFSKIRIDKRSKTFGRISNEQIKEIKAKLMKNL